MLDDFAINDKVDVVVRPEDVQIVEAGKGQVDGVIISSIFKGIHYEMTFQIGKTEITIQSTIEHKVGEKVGIIIEPDGIHIMAKNYTSNVYDGYIDKNNKVCFAEGAFDCDVTKLYPGSHLDEEGYLITLEGEKLDLTDTEVKVEVPLDKIEIIDNEEDGTVSGTIVSILYKGDHYQVIVRTEEEEDFVIDTEYLWNEFDKVSVSIKPEDINISLKVK